MAARDDIDDIEDLVAAGDLKPSERYRNKKDVIVRGRKETVANGSAKALNGNEAIESVSNI